MTKRDAEVRARGRAAHEEKAGDMQVENALHRFINASVQCIAGRPVDTRNGKVPEWNPGAEAHGDTRGWRARKERLLAWNPPGELILKLNLSLEINETRRAQHPFHGDRPQSYYPY